MNSSPSWKIDDCIPPVTVSPGVASGFRITVGALVSEKYLMSALSRLARASGVSSRRVAWARIWSGVPSVFEAAAASSSASGGASVRNREIAVASS